MSELTPQARAFLRAHRDDGEPTPEDAQRVRAALEVSLAGAAGVGAAAWLTRLTLVKWGLVVTLGLGGAAVLVRLNTRNVPGPAPVAAHEPAQEQLPPPAQSPEVVAEALVPLGAPSKDAPPGRVVKKPRTASPAKPLAVVEAPPPVSPPEATREAVVDPPPTSPVTAVAPPPAPEDELVLVSRAQELLGEGRAREALEVLTRWEAHFASRAQFAEEALAARAIGLCLSGNQAQGREAARLYLERYPASPQRNRIERACP